MKIKKAVITLAHPGQKNLPLQHLMDRDGKNKSALQILVEEALVGGVEEIGLVICPGQEEAYRAAVPDHRERLLFLEQREPRGYGDALLTARRFVGSDPFLHMVGDHLALAAGKTRCAPQLVALAEQERCSVSAVQSTPESLLPYYGVVGGKLEPGQKGLYTVDAVREKPSPTEAEEELVVPGLRAGYYLCFFGMHVLTPSVMSALGTALEQAASPETVTLSTALHAVARREKYLAFEIRGARHNIGVPYGLFYAQLALALRGVDREDVLAELVAQLAQREGARA